MTTFAPRRKKPAAIQKKSNSHAAYPWNSRPTDGPQITDYLKGSIQQVKERLQQFIAVGCVHIGLQFMIPHYPERREQIETIRQRSAGGVKVNVIVIRGRDDGAMRKFDVFIRNVLNHLKVLNWLELLRSPR